MKLSRYNKIFKVENLNYVFNGMTCALANVNEEFFKLLDSVGIDDKFISDSEVFADMKDSGVIIENDYEEIEQLKKRFNSHHCSKNSASFTILPTLNCNYNCPYCYEQKEFKSIMTDKTVERTISFIKNSAKDSASVGIAWYGGEPLLAKYVIEKISNEVLSFCNDNNKKFHCSIVTNGYYINDETIKILLDAKVQRCQITLDGMESTHNSKRFMKNNKTGTFDITINSVKQLIAAGIGVSIRVNIDKNNISELKDILPHLKSVGIEKINVNLGWLNTISDVCAGIKNDCLSYEEYCKIVLDWNKLLVKHGFATSDLDFHPSLASPCSITGADSIVINPVGDISKCWNDAEDQDCCIGNVNTHSNFSELEPNHKYKLWSPFDYEKCLKCDVLPLCMGNCPFQTIREGTPQCSKWKYMIDDYMKIAVENGSEKNIYQDEYSDILTTC